MRVFASCVLALGIAALPATAAAGGAANDALGATGTNKAAVATATAPNAPVAVATKESPAKPAESSMESQLQQLRDLLEAQSKQLQLQSQQLLEQQQKMLELEAALHSAGPNAAVASASAAVQPAQAAQAAPDWKKPFDALEKKLGAIGPFSFSGDIRLRDEPFFGGPDVAGSSSNQSQVRNRVRIRGRLNLTAKLNDDISGGLSLATGDNNDPITSNQTLNQSFTRKPFMLDRAFIVYTPHQFKPLTLTGGKFAYPWYRTELTFDNDINPEGVAQKLEWKNDKWTFIKQFALVGFELPIGESSRNNSLTTFRNSVNAQFPYANFSIKQSVLYGGQIQTKWQLTDWLSVTADTAFYNFHNADPLLLANQVANQFSPGVGVYKLAGNGITSSYMTTTQSFTVPVAPTAGTCEVGPGGDPACTTTTVNSTVIGAKFNSKFALFDSILQFDIKTSSPKWPIRFLADYVQNTAACENNPGVAPVLPSAPPANATITTTQTNGACDPHDRRGHWLEARFGRQAEKGDWQFSYTHMLIQREAVMPVFDFSDMRQATNVQQNRVEVFYNWQKNVQFGFTGLFGRPLSTPGSVESELKRMQFDVVYKF